MKKWTSIALATCMAGSMFAFSGCGNGTPSGAVRGDYTEITSDNQEQVLQDIADFEESIAQVNNGGWMGDTSKSDWSYGISFATGLDVDYSVEEYAKGKLDLNSEFAIAMYKQKSDIAVKGNGTVKLGLKNTTKDEYEDTVTDVTMEAKTAMFDGYAYADVKMDGKVENESIADQMQEISGKVSYGALENFLGEYLGVFDFENIGSSSLISLVDVVETIQGYGLPISYELSEKSGLKLKASITKEMLESVFEELASDEEVSFAMSTDIPAVDVKTCKLDLYMVIGETGLLKQFSVDVNIDVEIPGDFGDSYFKVKGAMVMEADTNVKVSIDTSKKVNPKYTDYSMFLGMM